MTRQEVIALLNPDVERQSDIDAEIEALHETARRESPRPGRPHPDRDYPPYRSSVLRHPKRSPIAVTDPEAAELYGPVFGVSDVSALDADLTRQHRGEPLGERITVTGRILDRRGRPIRGQLVEIWQANAAGRYAHRRDQHPAPLDPNFTGAGRCLTDGDGRYQFTTIKPGPYPWRNHLNAWRPAHIVPPTGAKGLNLATADATLLAKAIVQAHDKGAESLLDAYSETALRRVWRAEHFSYFMTTMLHRDPHADEFAHRLQLSNLRYIAASQAAAASLAENYVGLPAV